MQKRSWMYIQQPHSYEIHCDLCGGSYITWSEYEKRIWCFKCHKDVKGTGGIFDGPIPLEIAKMMGISFDRFYFRDKTIRKMEIIKNKLVWRKAKK